MEARSLCLVNILQNVRSESFFMSGFCLFQGLPEKKRVLVSARALGSGARGGDVEERLPQLRSSLQVIHVGCGGLCVWAYRRKKQLQFNQGIYTNL